MNIKEYLFSLPEKINPASIEGANTNFQFDINGEGGGQYTLELDNGHVKIHEGFVGDPKCTVKVSAADLSSLLKKELNPMMALFTGKLKISNQGEMLKYAKMLGLM